MNLTLSGKESLLTLSILKKLRKGLKIVDDVQCVRVKLSRNTLVLI